MTRENEIINVTPAELDAAWEIVRQACRSCSASCCMARTQYPGSLLYSSTAPQLNCFREDKSHDLRALMNEDSTPKG